LQRTWTPDAGSTAFTRWTQPRRCDTSRPSSRPAPTSTESAFARSTIPHQPGTSGDASSCTTTASRRTLRSGPRRATDTDSCPRAGGRPACRCHAVGASRFDRISKDGFVTTTDPIELAPGTFARVVPGEPFAAQPALRLDNLACACRPATISPLRLDWPQRPAVASGFGMPPNTGGSTVPPRSWFRSFLATAIARRGSLATSTSTVCSWSARRGYEAVMRLGRLLSGQVKAGDGDLSWLCA